MIPTAALMVIPSSERQVKGTLEDFSKYMDEVAYRDEFARTYAKDAADQGLSIDEFRNALKKQTSNFPVTRYAFDDAARKNMYEAEGRSIQSG